MPGKKIRCGAVNSWSRSRPIIEPHSARRRLGAEAEERQRRHLEDGAARCRACPATISGVSEFGRIRRKRSPRGLSPRARDAVTKSLSRIDSTDARMMRA